MLIPNIAAISDRLCPASFKRRTLAALKWVGVVWALRGLARMGTEESFDPADSDSPTGPAPGKMRLRPSVQKEADLDTEAGGLTDYFAKSLVLEAAEEACGLPRNGYGWEISAPNTKRKSWLLRRVRNGSSFVPVAVGPDGPALDGIKELHQKELVRIKSLKQSKAIRAEWLELEGITTALAKELDRIANLALFPNKCILCTGP